MQSDGNRLEGRPDPLVGIERLVIDGTNLLHALRRTAVPPPAATLVGRLRALVPPTVAVVLILDGPPDRGLGTNRLASGITVRHAGREPADHLIEQLVIQRPVGVLVVTDDRALATSIRRAGADSIGAAWLVRRLGRERLSAPSSGRPLPPGPGPGSPDRMSSSRGAGGSAWSRSGQRSAPRPSGHLPGGSPAGPNDAAAGAAADAEADRPRWQPGRGATKKRGNPRRGRPGTRQDPPGS